MGCSSHTSVRQQDSAQFASHTQQQEGRRGLKLGWHAAVRWLEMKPAEAMGTFLKTWCGQWAGLTRGQLAIAVSAQCGKRKGVTSEIVRQWEQGQPPKSTAEFEALLTVMGRKGLSRPEVAHFRKSVLAAVCDRQYAGLFEDDSLAYREDVDQAAWRMRQLPDHPRDRNVVTLVACIKDLEAAVSGDTGYATDGSKRVRGRGQPSARHLLGGRGRSCQPGLLLCLHGGGWAVARFGTPEMRSALQGQVEGHLETIKSWTWWPRGAETAQYELFGAALVDGLWHEAERLAAGFESWQHEADIFGRGTGAWGSSRGPVVTARRLWTITSTLPRTPCGTTSAASRGPSSVPSGASRPSGRDGCAKPVPRSPLSSRAQSATNDQQHTAHSEVPSTVLRRSGLSRGKAGTLYREHRTRSRPGSRADAHPRLAPTPFPKLAFLVTRSL